MQEQPLPAASDTGNAGSVSVCVEAEGAWGKRERSGEEARDSTHRPAATSTSDGPVAPRHRPHTGTRCYLRVAVSVRRRREVLPSPTSPRSKPVARVRDRGLVAAEAVRLLGPAGQQVLRSGGDKLSYAVRLERKLSGRHSGPHRATDRMVCK